MATIRSSDDVGHRRWPRSASWSIPLAAMFAILAWCRPAVGPSGGGAEQAVRIPAASTGSRMGDSAPALPPGPDPAAVTSTLSIEPAAPQQCDPVFVRIRMHNGTAHTLHGRIELPWLRVARRTESGTFGAAQTAVDLASFTCSTPDPDRPPMVIAPAHSVEFEALLANVATAQPGAHRLTMPVILESPTGPIHIEATPCSYVVAPCAANVDFLRGVAWTGTDPIADAVAELFLPIPLGGGRWGEQTVACAPTEISSHVRRLLRMHLVLGAIERKDWARGCTLAEHELVEGPPAAEGRALHERLRFYAAYCACRAAVNPADAARIAARYEAGLASDPRPWRHFGVDDQVVWR